MKKMEIDKEYELYHYLDAIKALKYILQQSGDYYGHWINSIINDIKEWQTNQKFNIHIVLYGGMGSFNGIRGGPYLNTIKSIGYRLAPNPDDFISVPNNIRTMLK